MPEYIASGKDLYADVSVKVEAASASEALAAAKQRIPIITALERIEPDGSLTPQTDVPFDSPAKELRSASEAAREQAVAVQRTDRTRRFLLAMFCVVVGGGFLVMCDKGTFDRLRKIYFQTPATRP
jgi:hypothetical protein